MHFRHFSKPIPCFAINLLIEQRSTVGLGSWKTGLAMHQANLLNDTCGLNLWISWWRLWIRTLITCQEFPLSSLTVRRTQRWYGWQDLAIRKSGQRGHLSTCPLTMIAKGCNLQNFCMFVSTVVTTYNRSNSTWQRDVGFTQQLQEQASICECYFIFIEFAILFGCCFFVMLSGPT